MIDGTVEDISRSGVFFRSPKAIQAGSETEIQLELPGEIAVQLMATVVRVDESGMGLRFNGETERGRRPLANFIMRCHATHWL